MFYDEGKKALRYLMFLKEKRDGTINKEDVLTANPKEYVLTRKTQAHLQYQ